MELNLSLPKKMRCVDITEPGTADTLVIGQRPIPTLGDDEVLIKVAAAGVNRLPGEHVEKLIAALAAEYGSQCWR